MRSMDGKSEPRFSTRWQKHFSFAECCACYPYIFPVILSAHGVLHALDVGTDLLRRGGAILL